MLWVRGDDSRSIVWTSSGGASGRLLVSQGDERPDFVFCTQGVVAGLAARGKSPVIIASVHVADDVILPVFRSPRRPLAGSRSVYIPRSSIEYAFDQLLESEGVERGAVTVPSVEKPGFGTIVGMLRKPGEDKDALDFAILVDPFITNLMTERPGEYEIGPSGLYDMHYSVVVLEEDLKERRPAYLQLLREMIATSARMEAFSDEEFQQEVWGRKADGEPERLPPMMTYSRKGAGLQLHPARVRARLGKEIEYLTTKYPGDLARPDDIDSLVDESLLTELAVDRVHN